MHYKNKLILSIILHTYITLRLYHRAHEELYLCRAKFRNFWLKGKVLNPDEVKSSDIII